LGNVAAIPILRRYIVQASLSYISGMRSESVVGSMWGLSGSAKITLRSRRTRKAA
jgi:hypothetical protein